MSQKIVGNFKRVWRYQTSQCVRVMPDFKAIVCVEDLFPVIVATPLRRRNSAFDGSFSHVFTYSSGSKNLFDTAEA